MRFRGLLPALAGLLAVAALACDGGGGAPTPAPTQITPEAVFLGFRCDAAHPGTPPDAGAFPVEVTDSVGNTVTLEAPPERAVSLSAGHTEVLYAIGAGDQLAAVDNTSDCPQAAGALPQVDAFSPSVEAIADLQPDLVVIFFDPGDLQSSLQGLGIPVLSLATPDSVQGVYEQTALLGRASGHAAEADALVAAMRAEVEEVRSRVEGAGPGPRIFHEVDSTYYTAGPGSFIADLYSILGASNIAEATGQAFPQMSAEAIIQADPEVIVLADEDAGESPETVSARPGWENVAAVRDGRVHVVDPDIVSRPGPRLVEALRTLAAYLYPGLAP